MLTICVVAIIAIFLSHPIRMAGLLIINSVVISFYLLVVTVSWLFYLLILIFLGGVIVIITYITSLAANEKLFISLEAKRIVFLIAFLLAAFPSAGHQKLTQGRNFIFVKRAYEPIFLFLLIRRFIVLLLRIIRVIKLISLEKGPLIKRL